MTKQDLITELASYASLTERKGDSDAAVFYRHVLSKNESAVCFINNHSAEVRFNCIKVRDNEVFFYLDNTPANPFFYHTVIDISKIDSINIYFPDLDIS